MNQFEPLGLPFVHDAYEGVPLVVITPARRIKEIQEVHKSRTDDVYIATFPKCGTTWLQQILCILYDYPQGESTDIIHDSPWIEHLEQEAIDSALSPRVFKTHLKWKWVPKSDGVKYIYCYRNPKDVVVSYYKHMKTMEKAYQFSGTFEQFVDEVFLPENASENGSYFNHVAEWMAQKHNENIHFLSYEDLSEDFEKAVTGIAKFLNITVSEEMMKRLAKECSFEAMKNNDKVNYSWLNGIVKDPNSHFMRKGKVGGWKDILGEEQSKKIEEMTNERLIPLGANIRYEL